MSWPRAFFILLLIILLSFCFSNDKGRTRNEQTSQPIDWNAIKPKFPFKGKIALQSDLDGDHEIYLLTESGLQKLTDNSWDDEFPRWSPDGTKIAFTANRHGNYDIFVMDIDGANCVQITDSPRDEVELAWFPEETKIAYTEEVKRRFGKSFTLWEIDLKTKEKRKIIPEFDGSNALPNFSPTSPLMVFTGKRMMGWDVFLFDWERGEIHDLVKGGKSCRGSFSKDGQKIAYVSSEADGKGDIWMMNPDGSGKERLTHRDETFDYYPSWSPDGKYVVFASSLKHYPHEGNWALYLVRVSTKTVIPLLDYPGKFLFPDWY